LSKQGATEPENLAFACQGCNNRKYTAIDAVDPITYEIAPLYHPRQQRWSEHFAWNEDCTLVIGLTPTGRATVEKLDLNRAGLMNLHPTAFFSREIGSWLSFSPTV
jgi:hypothetical protein